MEKGLGFYSQMPELLIQSLEKKIIKFE